MRSRFLLIGLLLWVGAVPARVRGVSFLSDTPAHGGGPSSLDRRLLTGAAAQTVAPRGAIFTPKSRVSGAPRHANRAVVFRVVRSAAAGTIGWLVGRTAWLPAVGLVCDSGASCRAANVAVTSVGAAGIAWKLPVK